MLSKATLLVTLSALFLNALWAARAMGKRVVQQSIQECGGGAQNENEKPDSPMNRVEEKKGK